LILKLRTLDQEPTPPLESAARTRQKRLAVGKVEVESCETVTD
jgi:hypothetical protein